MTVSRLVRSRPSLLIALVLTTSALACDLRPALAQDNKDVQEKGNRAGDQNFPDGYVLKVYRIANATNQNDANEILVALRNMLPPASRIYLVNSTGHIAILTTPVMQAAAESLLKQLDLPRHTYRLTWTLAESDNGKRVGIQHLSMVALEGQRIVFKQGDKVPVSTGSYSSGSSGSAAGVQTQVTYLDVGINVDVTPSQLGSGIQIKSKVEQSSVAPETQSGRPSDDPILRQSVLEGTSTLVFGKPTNLGGIDIVGSTRHIDIEVVAEQIS